METGGMSPLHLNSASMRKSCSSNQERTGFGVVSEETIFSTTVM